MAEVMTKERVSVEQVADIIRRMSHEEVAELVRLVPDLQEVEAREEKPIPTKEWDEAELREYFLRKLEELGGEFRPMQDDDPFLGGLTVGEFFALPDEEQEAIWNQLHAEEEERLDGYEHPVRPDAVVPARQERHS